MSDPKVRVVYEPLDELVRADHNPKEHASEVIEASVRRHGFVEPLVVNEKTGKLVAGHGRLDVLTRMHAAGEEPPGRVVSKKGRWFVPVLRGISWERDQDAAAYLVASNQTTILGGWDDEQLGVLLADIAGVETPEDLFRETDEILQALDGTGFSFRDLRRIVPVSGHTRIVGDPDAIPPTPKDPVTRTGDRIVLGNHVLVCGDSRDPEVLKFLMGDELADIVLTDPPYGVDYVGRRGNALSREDRLADSNGEVFNDDLAGLEPLLRDAFTNFVKYTRVGAPWFACGPPGPPAEYFLRVLRELGVIRQILTWVKSSLVMGRSDFHYRNEFIFYGWSPGGPHRAPKDRKQDTVWEFERPSASEDHPTSKPVPMFEHALDVSSDPGSIVLDGFVGGGTTLIACEMQGRRARCVEFSPAYCDVVVRRWEELTGRTAERPVRRRARKAVA